MLLVAAAGFAIAEVLLVAAICNLMFSLIAYAIGDLLESVLDLQIACDVGPLGAGFVACSSLLVLLVLAGWPGLPCW